MSINPLQWFQIIAMFLAAFWVMCTASGSNYFKSRRRKIKYRKENQSGEVAQINDGERMSQFAISLHKYPALMTTCPEMHFVEWDFFKELPFLIEKDLELLKQAGWLLRQAREINKTISDRNQYIQAAMSLTTSRRGGLYFYQLDGVLHSQVSISNAECVTALKFFRVLLDMAKRLEAIGATYTTS
jgi:hypothetical protein